MSTNLTASRQLIPGGQPEPSGLAVAGSTGTLEKAMSDHIARMRKRAANPPVDIRDGAVYLATRQRAQPYEISLDAVKTEAQLLGWIVHLSDKKWFTASKCGLLIEAMHEHWGKKVQF